MNLNTIVFEGNLAAAPKLERTTNGTAVTDAVVLVNRRVKDADEQWVDAEPTRHRDQGLAGTRRAPGQPPHRHHRARRRDHHDRRLARQDHPGEAHRRRRHRRGHRCVSSVCERLRRDRARRGLEHERRGSLRWRSRAQSGC
jgi:hypothetical protein